MWSVKEILKILTQNWLEKKIIMQSKYPVCRIKKSRFVKEQEAKGLLSNLGIKTQVKFNRFECNFIKCSV